MIMLHETETVKFLLEIEDNLYSSCTLCPNQMKIVTLNANIKEIITLVTHYGQIRQKLLLEMQILREIVTLHTLWPNQIKLVTPNTNTKEIILRKSSL